MSLVAIPTQVLRVNRKDTLITSDTPITLRTTTSNYLETLKDVNVTGAANNSLFVYNTTLSKWEDHLISGTANEVEVSFSSQDIIIGLPNDVTVSTLTATTVTSTNFNIETLSFNNIDCGEF